MTRSEEMRLEAFAQQALRAINASDNGNLVEVGLILLALAEKSYLAGKEEKT